MNTAAGLVPPDLCNRHHKIELGRMPAALGYRGVTNTVGT
jgi:hypothetical protein